jgi:divalent metal cation (Fe/Co/Zn/Cd) transporter
MSTPGLELPIAPPAPAAPVRDAGWLAAARRARQLSWLSLGWMTLEGLVGIAAGIAAGSVALVGFGLSSAVEGLASVIVIWRFTGSRTHSETSEHAAQKAVGVSFFLLAPYVAFEAIHKLATAEKPSVSVVGIALTTGSLIFMPLLGRAKHRLGERLGSGATAGEGTQNILCALLAGAVLIGLVANAVTGAWFLDPIAALLIAGVAVKEGRQSWRGKGCCAPTAHAAGPAACDDDCCD